jgi:hypothetical protein
MGSQLPAYVTNPVVNSFDRQFSVYNWKPSNAHVFVADLIKAAFSQAQPEIVVIGDSWGAGCTASSPSVVFDRLNAYPVAMSRELVRRGIPRGGTGMVRINDNALAIDPRWAVAGTGWNHGGKFYSFTGTLNDTATFTAKETGQKFILTYVDHNDSATFTVSVDGASSGAGWSGTITNNGGSVAIKQLVLTVPINIGSTVVVKKTSATGANYLDIIGAQTVDPTRGGLIVHNLSQSSSTATGTGAGAWSDSSAITSLGYLLNNLNKITAGAISNPHMIIELGGNDHPVLSGADSTHALISAITTAVTTIRNKTTGFCMLVMSGQLVDSVVPQANWEAYLNAMYSLADTLDIPLFDAYAKMGDYDQCVADGWVIDGAGHWISPAYRFWGRTIAATLAAEFGNIDTPQVLTMPAATSVANTTPDGTLIVKYTP